MRTLLLSAIFAFAANDGNAQTPEFFQPYQPTELRMPSVPLLVSDPYFSVWSPYDQLMDGPTTHWTNQEKPFEGLLRVDGTTYRWMGASHHTQVETVVPMADEAAWEGVYTREKPQDGWEQPKFNDSKWTKGKGAFGSKDYTDIGTPWFQEDDNIYVRRKVNLTEEQLDGELFLIFSHDDACEIYINGTQIVEGIMDYEEGVIVRLTPEQKNLLKKGENVFAAHCYNGQLGALIDFGLYHNKSFNSQIINAVQKSVNVLACNTYYTFQAGPVELDVVFTAPQIINDYDLLSAPINYISYQVRSTDGKEHDVNLYISTTTQLALNELSQPTVSSLVKGNNKQYLKTGTIEQPILAKTGDGISIDWGYLYFSGVNGKLSLEQDDVIIPQFVANGTLPAGTDKQVSQQKRSLPTLAYCHDFGKVKQGASFAMVGYDEIEDIEYFFKRYKAYWAHEGKVSIFDMFDRMERDYTSIMERCRAMDKTIYDDGLKAGNKKYAEILSGAYRHVNAAHKLFRDDEGNLLFFSKENNSNGCVNTVDLTYPESPLYLVYNPELQKAMMTSIFEYSYSGRWTKPFAAHDLGQYPKANYQVYGGDMPLEESGNMLTLAAEIARIEGNADYVAKYWDIVTTWADYLVENGLHPANQLCTDDFAGHWAGNCNLAIKAIMGIAGYAELARMRGEEAVYEKYMAKAREMAATWEKETRLKDHYELAYGSGENTWSQKYNMIWDKLWGTNILPNKAMATELKYYLKQQNEYGLPLDCRKDYTKSDWIMWTAAMAEKDKDFLQFVDPLYKYINETTSRVPTSDWHDTKTGRMIGFKARSVIGGYWMRVLTLKTAK